jgi:hypothetical protein
MAAPKGNRFWEARSSHGRNPIFSSPEVLWEACLEYFKWVEDNPLYEEKAFCFQGVVTTHQSPKMRAMTLSALCLFLDITDQTWINYRNKEDFLEVTRKADKFIYDQKFSGASADMLNANIIARDLGLKEKSIQEQSGPDGGAIKHEWILNVRKAKAPGIDEEKG